MGLKRECSSQAHFTSAQGLLYNRMYKCYGYFCTELNFFTFRQRMPEATALQTDALPRVLSRLKLKVKEFKCIVLHCVNENE